LILQHSYRSFASFTQDGVKYFTEEGLTTFTIDETGFPKKSGKLRVPGVFSRDENSSRQNRENTIWQF
jgi:hypothetical protein